MAERQTSGQGILWGFLTLISFSVALALIWSWQRRHRDAPLPVFGVVPSFRLTSHTGKPISLKDLKGHVWVAEFFFASCAGMCLKMNANMAKVQRAFRHIPKVKIVSFTVDPDRDTVSVLSEYAKNWGAVKGQWFFVTGAKKVIYRLARHGFKLAVREVPPEEEGGPTDFIHSDRFVLIDQDGRIRGYYRGTEPKEVARLIADIHRLLSTR